MNTVKRCSEHGLFKNKHSPKVFLHSSRFVFLVKILKIYLRKSSILTKLRSKVAGLKPEEQVQDSYFLLLLKYLYQKLQKLFIVFSFYRSNFLNASDPQVTTRFFWLLKNTFDIARVIVKMRPCFSWLYILFSIFNVLLTRYSQLLLVLLFWIVQSNDKKCTKQQNHYIHNSLNQYKVLPVHILKENLDNAILHFLRE